RGARIFALSRHAASVPIRLNKSRYPRPRDFARVLARIGGPISASLSWLPSSTAISDQSLRALARLRDRRDRPVPLIGRGGADRPVSLSASPLAAAVYRQVHASERAVHTLERSCAPAIPGADVDQLVWLTVNR